MRGKILSVVLAFAFCLAFPSLASAQTTNNNNNPQNNSNNPTTNTNQDNQGGNQGNTGNPGNNNPGGNNTNNPGVEGNPGNNSTGSSNAPKNPMMLVHAFNPIVMSQGPAVRARVNNWTGSHQMKLVCVEAMKVGGGNTHLGCLSVHLMPKMSMDGDWAKEFDAPLSSLASGNYNITFNYQDNNGRWFPVTNLDGSTARVAFNK